MLWPLIIYILLVAAVIIGMLGISFFLGERRSSRASGEVYESGIIAAGSVNIRVPIHYFVLAVMFVLFDLEAVFLYLWAVSLREVGWPGFAAAALFIAILLLALAYLLKNGLFTWATARPPVNAMKKP